MIVALVSYLIGGIPTAYLAARLVKGQDIRQVGDRNVGAANVYRNIGSFAGIAVGIIDIAKGSAAVLLVRWLMDSPTAEMIAGVAVLAGHNWPVYFRLRGGRGAATAVGVLLVMLPALAIPFGVLCFAVLCLTRKAITSLGLFLIFVPVFAWWPYNYTFPMIAYALGVGLLVGASHFLSTRMTWRPEKSSEQALSRGQIPQ